MLHKKNPQLNRHGELVHLLSVEGLPRDIVTHILDTASSFVSVSDRARPVWLVNRSVTIFSGSWGGTKTVMVCASSPRTESNAV